MYMNFTEETLVEVADVPEILKGIIADDET